MSSTKWHNRSLSRVWRAAVAGVALALGSCGLNAFAGVLVRQNVAAGATVWPGAPAIQTVTNPSVQLTVGESFNSAGGGCTNYGETFTIGGSNLTLQTISLYAGGGSGTGTGTNLTLHLFHLGSQTAPNPSPYSPGSDLFNSGNGLSISYAPQTTGVLAFDFDGGDQVTLTNGHMYAFEISGVLNSSPVAWWRAVGDTYSGGAAYRNRSWINGNNARDFGLAVYGVGTAAAPPPLQQRDLVSGNLIQFNDNGAWTWYSDERTVVDSNGGRIVVGTDGSAMGLGGAARDGAVEAAMFDIASGTSQRTILMPSGTLGPDDHNGPAFLVRPDGKYLAQWTGHNANYLSYFRVFSGGSWQPTFTFDWTTVGAAQANELASYSNPHYLAAEHRTYSIVRCMDNHSPHILVSSDYGDTWSYFGKLVRPSTNFNVGYNPGYFRYCDDGVGRIDFICTEAHPRDYTTSIYHGYISNGMSFKTDGTVVASDLTNTNDANVPFSASFTPVFTNGTVLPPGMTNYRCWNDDVQRYPDGTIECLISARINQSTSFGYPDTGVNPNHAFFFARYDGTKWTPTYLCQAGYKLYSSEGDYVGLGSLSPSDPNTIYLSTQWDPRTVQPGVTDTNPQFSASHEIWKGVTTNHGASFTWTPITQSSVRDNVRPLVPPWSASDTALIWFRGSYSTAQIFDEAPVGMVEHRNEVVGQMHYVDANAGAGGNTTLTNGATLTPGAGLNQWHLQSGPGNGGTILSSADSTGETPPMITTTVAVPGPGTYDLWVNFWGTGTTGADWRIVAGISPATLQTYRAEKCEQVQAANQDSDLLLTNTAPTTNYLYQAYVGRAVPSVSNTVTVFVGGNAIQTGTVNTLVGNTCRTWYDGVSYAKVDSFRIRSAVRVGPSSVAVVWNSPRPGTTLTTPTYTLQKKYSLTDTNWTTVATGIPSGGFTTTNFDNSATGDAAFYRVSWP